jgi:mono/diheme cytochrome c family protein
MLEKVMLMQADNSSSQNSHTRPIDHLPGFVAGRNVVFIFIVLFLFATVSGCLGATAAMTTTTVPTSPTATTGETAAQLAEAGFRVFQERCGDCHGMIGEGGPATAIIGQASYVAAYGTAKDLLNYISATMPLDPQRTLSPSQCLQVTVYILLQNNYVAATTVINDSVLSGIKPTKQIFY